MEELAFVPFVILPSNQFSLSLVDLPFWDDVDAIKRFAGEDYQQARYYDFDEGFLVEKEPFARHFEVYKG